MTTGILNVILYKGQSSDWKELNLNVDSDVIYIRPPLPSSNEMDGAVSRFNTGQMRSKRGTDRHKLTWQRSPG